MYVVVFVTALYPLAWLTAISLQPAQAAFHLPPRFIFVPDLSNYRRVLGDAAFRSSIVDSLAVAVPATLLCVVLGAMAGYAFSRFDVRGARTLSVVLVVTRLVPAFAIVVPTFIIYRRFNLLDTTLGLVLAMAAFQLPIAVLVMYRIMDAIPRALDEAARIDGAGTLGVLVRVIVPVAAPGLAASGVLTFVLLWNEFLFVLILAGNSVITLPVTIATFEGQRQILWGPIAAASLIAVLPILALIVAAQRQLLAGLGLGSVQE
jgi:multiple sugar transport system permease protein